MAKTYKLSKLEICDLYDLNPSTLDYHINNRKPSKSKPLAFPKGVYNSERKCKLYDAADVKKYADQSFRKKEDVQRPLKLSRPVNYAEVAKEWEPRLNELFGAAAQQQEQKAASEAIERAFEKLLKEEKKKNQRQQKIIITLFILIFVILFIPLAL